MLQESYRDWAGVRFRQAITGRANSLGRAHDREVCASSPTASPVQSTLNESVETAFMPVPHVLKAVLGDFNSFQLPEDDGVLGDDAVVLYLANSVLAALACRCSTASCSPSRTGPKAPALAASRYRPPPCVVLSDGGGFSITSTTSTTVATAAEKKKKKKKKKKTKGPALFCALLLLPPPRLVGAASKPSLSGSSSLLSKYVAATEEEEEAAPRGISTRTPWSFATSSVGLAR